MSTILITGASRGIGRATALQFATPGNTLILVCKSNIDRLNELAEELRARGAIVLPVQADISDSAEVSCLFDTIESRGLSVDLLINNAGISYTGLLQDMTDTEWHTILDTNLSSIFYCCRAVIPMMLKNGQGKIINISSIWGEYGASCEVAYSTTKAALIGFVKALAKEVGPSGITVNAIAPGVIKTDMNASLDESTLASLAEETPLCRLGTAAEVARVALFLLGDGGDFITGQTNAPNGGLVM